jgi:hypothetical protein
MPRRPFLIFPRSVPVERERLPKSYVPRTPIGRRWQDSHVAQPLQRLEVALARRTLELSTAAPGAVAEEVLVFETIGNVTDFMNAVRRIPGLEWLISFDIPDQESATPAETAEDDFAEEGNRLFALATDAQALKQLLTLWKRYEQGQKLERPFGIWTQVFQQLREVRTWSVKDRLHETGMTELWRDALEMGDPSITFAVELWFRENANTRRQRLQQLQAAAASLGGRVEHPYEHEPTAFHGALATFPPAVVRQFLEQPDASAFLQRTEVMYCRPQGQTGTPLKEGDAFGVATNSITPPAGAPVAALLDGLPVENHVAYAGWLRVDDPDGWAATYEVRDRQHGTGMASLIVRGDMSLSDAPLTSPLYVRPILKPDPADFRQPRREAMPFERFPQDLLEVAVRRFKTGTDTVPATAPTVHVVNLSVGDPSRLFDGSPSPWGRMVDYLAHRHNLLFTISAGNHASFRTQRTLTEWESLAPAALEQEALLACWQDVRNRRLLSPAEAINAVTVAGLHTDESGPPPPLGVMGTIPIQNPSIACTTSAFGPGPRRSVKPDVALPGGRSVMRAEPGLIIKAAGTARPPGQLVAVPTPAISSTGHTRGTSNAAALATRQAVTVIETLRGLSNGEAAVPDEFMPVLAKAMVAHAASSEQAAARLREVFDPGHGQRIDLFRKRHVLSTVGYGSVDPGRATGADDHRATLIGWGALEKDEGHEFSLPLPPSLNAIRGKRRLTFTLAWFSPINPHSRAYRCARLWFSTSDDTLATKRAQAERFAVRNGTLQHEIWEGEQAAAFAAGTNLIIRVNCREDGGKLLGPVRYGLAVSIEAAVELALPIYEEVRQAIAVREQIRPA